jgi:hypothetical protein
MKMNGFAWGAVATAAMFVYVSFINEIQVLGENADGSFFVRYSCGHILNPEYPLDGKGPCTGPASPNREVESATTGWPAFRSQKGL